MGDGGWGMGMGQEIEAEIGTGIGEGIGAGDGGSGIGIGWDGELMGSKNGTREEKEQRMGQGKKMNKEWGKGRKGTKNGAGFGTNNGRWDRRW